MSEQSVNAKDAEELTAAHIGTVIQVPLGENTHVQGELLGITAGWFNSQDSLVDLENLPQRTADGNAYEGHEIKIALGMRLQQFSSTYFVVGRETRVELL